LGPRGDLKKKKTFEHRISVRNADFISGIYKQMQVLAMWQFDFNNALKCEV
jgi:hypothetical protein